LNKIPSLFQRNYETDRFVRDEVLPGSEWVLNGEGIATRKYDGTCCMIKNGELYARYDVKKGKTAPEGFIPAQDPDETTGHWPGWVKCNRDDKQWQWHFEAFDKIPFHTGDNFDRTYELCGPKIQNNPEQYENHVLISHAEATKLIDAPRTYDELKSYFIGKDIEGIVWHHPDGRMVKIKKRDFGMKR
jgi:hypothetical protein